MHIIKSISETGPNSPQGHDQCTSKSVSQRLRRQNQSSTHSDLRASDLPSVAFLRSGWLLLTGLGLVSLFYAAILIYHVSVPLSESREHSFMEQTRRLCIRYGLVSSLNPEPAVPKQNDTAAQNNVVSTLGSEDQRPDDLQNSR